jgi:hypothetical protein
MNHLENFFLEKEKENIIPVKIPNKREYIMSLINIEHSLTGRKDAQISNIFIMEAVQLILNAIFLFEKGYFDCAYYSLRQSIEVATTMIYLSDIPEPFRKEQLEAWEQTKNFPMQSQMLASLKENGYLFSDLKQKLSDYFLQLSLISKQLNKFVHKQGWNHYYVFRNHLINRKKEDVTNYIAEFESYLVRCIGALAIMRLAIDPYPILLMDEEIYFRSSDTLTEPYNEEFVKKYIGLQVITDFKKTEIYKLHYEHHIQKEKKLYCIADIVKHQYINRKHIKEIITQLHLLENDALWAVMLVLWCKKIVKIYYCEGLRQYLTDSTTNRKTMSWSGADFKKFSESSQKYNQKYDEAYISVFLINNEYIFLEHNEILTDEEIKTLNFNISKFSRE